MPGRKVKGRAEPAAADKPRDEVDDEVDVDHLGIELRQRAPRLAAYVGVAARALALALGQRDAHGDARAPAPSVGRLVSPLC